MTWASNIAELLWRSAWAVIPLVLLVAAICRWAPCRPVTRHTLWVLVLISFAAPLAAPFLPLPDLAPLTNALLPDEKQSTTAADESAAPGPLLFALGEGESEGYIVVPSARVSAELLALFDNARSTRPDTADTAEPDWFTNTADTAVPHRTADTAVPRWGTDTTDTTVPCWTEPVVWHGRVGRELMATDVDARNSGSASARAEEHQALALLDPARPAPAVTALPLGDKEKPASSSSTWRAWVAALAGVRNALFNLPTLPPVFWLAGIGALIAIYAGSAIRFRRRLRRSEPAPKPVRRMVAKLARRMKLRRVPDTVVVNEAVSPMVWCGGRVRLVLPTGLWAQLDRVGREAILCHELAHLRRRDHWVRWLELLISVSFWWHPLVWWVRRRLHEEADLCCDAWVTWLMPRRRRAYAEALLVTREHIGAGRRMTPAVAVGAMTSGAKRFARRITMVMTQSPRPGISMAGIGLACVLTLAGWLAAPAWCSPLPDDDQVVCKKVVVTDGGVASCGTKADASCDTKCKVYVTKGDAAACCCPKCSEKCATKCDVKVIKGGTGAGCCPQPGTACQTQCKTIVIGGDAGEQEYGEQKVLMKMLGGLGGGVDSLPKVYAIAGGDDEGAVRAFTRRHITTDDTLEQRLAKLEQIVQQLDEALGGKSIDIRIPKPPKAPVPPAPPCAPAPGAPMIWHTPQAGTIKIGDLDGIESFALGLADDTGEKIVRAYKLPEGKLQALTALMAREDVPVLVSPKDDCIEVHGTKRQQKILKAFVDMIHPEGKTSAKKYDAAEQKCKIIVNGTDLSDLLDSEADVGAFMLGDDGTYTKAFQFYEDALGKLGECKVVVPDIKVEINEEIEKQIKEQTKQIKEHAKQFREQAKVYHESVKEAEELRKQAAELQREAERLREMAEKAEAETR